MSPSPQLCRCLPKRRRAPTHGRRQHSWWSEPSPPGGTARLATGTPRRRPPLSSGPTSVWRQPSLSAALRGRQRAAQSFWCSECGPGICAMLLRDTVMLRLDLPPPRQCLQVHHLITEGRGGNLRHVSRPGSQDNVRVDRPEHKALFAYRKRLEVPDPFDGSERGQERCLKRQELQLDWVQRPKGAPLKSSQDDREVRRGREGWPGGIHPPGLLQEPHDEIMLSQGPAVHCIVVGRDSGYIHFQGGGWQPTLQPFLQERKHNSNRASLGFFSVSHPRTHLQRVGSPDSEDNDRVHHPQTGNDRNQKDKDETASWKRRDRPWFALLEFALLVEVPRGIADERNSADRTVTSTMNKTKMNGFVEISTLLIHSAPKQKSNQWTHLLPFYTRMHGEWLRYAKSTSQFHWRFLFSQRWSGLPSKSLMSSRHNS